MEAARQHPAEAVPLHIRNAPTRLMEDLGYGAGYQYAHAVPDAYVPQEYLPESLRGAQWYEPSEFGYEKDIKKRMEGWGELKKTAAGRGGGRGGGRDAGGEARLSPGARPPPCPPCSWQPPAPPSAASRSPSPMSRFRR